MVMVVVVSIVMVGVVQRDGGNDSYNVMMIEVEVEKGMIGGDDEVPLHRLLLLQL